MSPSLASVKPEPVTSLITKRFVDAMQRFHRLIAGAILGRMIYHGINAATF